MLGNLVSWFIQAWFVGLIALFLGRYVGPRPPAWPSGLAANTVAFLKVWAITFIAQLTFSGLGRFAGVSDQLQNAAIYFFPVMIGAIYARTLLHSQSSGKTSVKQA